MGHTHTTNSLISRIFIILCTLISAAGLIHTSIALSKLIAARQAAPFFFNGIKVAGLNRILGKEKYIGYYTDRDIVKDPKALAQFAQFQLELAPLIMDNTSLDHRFLILDCANPQNAMNQLQLFKARALSRNNFGMILAVREGF